LPVPPKLPKTAPDGTQVLDRVGVIWIYDANVNAWIYSGSVGDPNIVNEEEEGLITPEIVEQLDALRDSMDAGVDFGIFKIYPATSAYWYYLRSNNNTISFTPESENELRLEVNKSWLLALLSRMVCPGPRGERGVQGIPGNPGRPARNEPVHIPAVVGKIMEIDAGVVSTLDTPISIRVYKNESTNPVLTIFVPLDGSDFTIEQIDYEIEIDEQATSLLFDEETSRVIGSIVSVNDWGEAEWEYKAWQIGRKGPRGFDGRNFLEVIPKDFEDESLRSKEAVVSMRQGGIRGDLFFQTATLFEKNTVSRLSFSNVCREGATFRDICLAAVQMTTASAKDIGRFCFNPDDEEYKSVTLPAWTPVEACWRQRHWTISQFKWTDLTQVDRNDVIWQVANKRESEDPSYPWPLDQPKPPGERCCQEDFFFCPNVNDQPCGITSPVGEFPVITPPPVPQICCECDCPIALDLQDGYDFDEVGLNSDETVVIGVDDIQEFDVPCQNITCTLDGAVHEYRQRIVVEEQREPIKFTINLASSYDPLCDEARGIYWDDLENDNVVPSFASDCGKAVEAEECPYEWSVRDVSDGAPQPGLEPMIRDGMDYHVVQNGESVSLEYEGQSGVIDLHILVNLQRVSCCLAYGLEICINHPNRLFDAPVLPPSPTPSAAAAAPSPAPSPSPSAPGALAFEATPDACGLCPQSEDHVEWAVELIDIISPEWSGEADALTGLYITAVDELIRPGNTAICRPRGSPVATTLSSTGFATMLVEYDIEKEQVIVLMAECDDQGFSTNVGAFGLKWVADMTCDDFANNRLPVMSFAGVVGRGRHPVTDARIRIESFSPLNQ